MEGRTNPFLNRRVAFQGKLGGMTLREAGQLVRRLGGTPVPRDDERIDLLVIGADANDGNVEFGPISTLAESQLWEALGLLNNAEAGQLYTPAMLSELLGVSVASIRRWHRLGLIQAHCTVHRLPYFTFQEISVARQLAEIAIGGASAATIQQQLQQLAKHFPQIDRPLAELKVILEGRRLLVARNGELHEANGQKRLPLDGVEESDQVGPALIPLRSHGKHVSSQTSAQLLALAEAADDSGDDITAAELYRTALAAGGPDAQICFQLAECLYRLGELSAARERYSMALEIDDRFVEARANLGCVLAELGQTELAIAALEGTLQLSPKHADAHYHLSQLYCQMSHRSKAEQHREQFQKLSPGSPWASLNRVLPGS